MNEEEKQELEQIISEHTLVTIASRRPFEVMYKTVDGLMKDNGKTDYTFKDFDKVYTNTLLDAYNVFRTKYSCGNHNAQYATIFLFYRDVFEAELNPGMAKKYLTGGKI